MPAGGAAGAVAARDARRASRGEARPRRRCAIGGGGRPGRRQGGPGADPAGAAGGVLVHVRFSFDRTPLRRMHAALAHAAHTGDKAVSLLPVRFCLICCSVINSSITKSIIT